MDASDWIHSTRESDNHYHIESKKTYDLFYYIEYLRNMDPFD